MIVCAEKLKRGFRPAGILSVFRQIPACLAVTLAAAALAMPAHAAKAKPKRERYVYAPPQAALVVDGYTGKIIHASNPDEPRYPASITKVMTLYLLFEKLRDKRMSLDTPLRITANAAAQPPSKLGLEPGKTISVREVIYALITKSANDCAVVVAENLAGSEEAFAAQMTGKARALGMPNTVFRNASGLPNAEQRTTARDLVTLGRRILADFPEHTGVFRTRFFSYGGASHRNHNGLLFSYQGTEGLKTGFTHASGFNLLTSARRDKRHLVAVVLGGRSALDRNARMRLLLNGAWARAAEGSKIKIAPPPDVSVEVASAVSDIPERNPAFHSTVSERSLKAAMVVMLDLERRKAEATQESAEVASAEEEMAEAAEQQPAAGEPPVELAAVEDDAEETASAQEQGDTAAAKAAVGVLGPYHVQVGSYADAASAKVLLDMVAAKAKDVVSGHKELTVAGSINGKARYRARFGKFTEVSAKSACGKLKALDIDCLVVRAD